MSKPKVLVEKLIKARHLKKYVKEGDHKEESGKQPIELQLEQ